MKEWTMKCFGSKAIKQKSFQQKKKNCLICFAWKNLCQPFSLLNGFEGNFPFWMLSYCCVTWERHFRLPWKTSNKRTREVLRKT